MSKKTAKKSAGPERTIVTFLLDETGSMMSVKDDTIGGFNSYLASLRQLPGDVAFTFLKFDSNRVEKVCVGKPVADVADLTADTYQPGAMTPLYDAAVKAIDATAEVVATSPGAKVLVVLQTDGHENASRQHSKADLADRIKARTAEGWQFVFLGCGLDAYGEAASLGIAKSATMSYGAQNSAQAFAAVADTTWCYAAGQGFALSDEQKAAAGDVWAIPGGGSAGRVTPKPASHASKPTASLVDDIKLTA